jgi:hypothetical protein
MVRVRVRVKEFLMLHCDILMPLRDILGGNYQQVRIRVRVKLSVRVRVRVKVERRY